MSARRLMSFVLGAALGVCALAGPVFAQPQEEPLRARKGFGAKKGLRRLPPGSRMEALERMTPEQRERFLNSLPAQRRAEAERRLNAWRQMTPVERARARQTLGEFRDLSPDRQRRIRMLYGEFNGIPPERQPLLRAELTELRHLDPAGSRARMNTEEFRGKYSPAERRLLGDLSEALPRQGAGAGTEEEEQP